LSYDKKKELVVSGGLHESNTSFPFTVASKFAGGNKLD
jgi:hypothetical protein